MDFMLLQQLQLWLDEKRRQQQQQQLQQRYWWQLLQQQLRGVQKQRWQWMPAQQWMLC
jgi:hypothetical protein